MNSIADNPRERAISLDTPAAWRLTAAISPRPTVRAATVDASGAILNVYPPSCITPVTAEPPTTPWAVYLTDRDHRYRLVCFDLDGKTPEAAAAAEKDAAALARLLSSAGLAPVVCQSNPRGGRHVWIALAESAPADLVHRLARLAKALHRTLDLSPVKNVATGCVRPPGAPHRDGGRSTVIDGELHQLTHPTGTLAQLIAATEALAQLVNERAAAAGVDAPPADVQADDGRHDYIPGPKRELSAAAGAALRDDTTGADASAVLWRVLLGAVAAHWHYADIARLVPTAPGLEHVRTRQEHGRRVPRSSAETRRVLRYQWDKAVAHVARGRRIVGADDTFDGRAEDIAHQVRDVQERADASPGRWHTGGGPADRRVLDALCILALQAVRASVEADTRRLALMVGVGRETARTALLRLADDGWIVRTRPADGPHAAHWTIDPRDVLHREPGNARSQAAHRPPSTGTAARNALLLELTDRMHAAAHDLFTPRGLGFHAGNVYARCASTPLPLATLTRLTDIDAARTVATLTQLTEAGVVQLDRGGWRRSTLDVRDAAAAARGIAGQLAARAERYAIERELWAWWLAELDWMNTAPAERSKRPAPGQLTLVPDLPPTGYPIHPRTPDGRADYRTARRYLTATDDEQPQTPTRPVALTDADRIVIEVLGATLIAVETYDPDADTQPYLSRARPRSGRGSPETDPATPRRKVAFA